MILLCVDDDPDDIDLFCEAIRTINPAYVCLIARNGKEALHLLETISPKFIFLDINMPLMGGKETLLKIRSNKTLDEVPVIMLSTSIKPKEMIDYKKSGASLCLVKPNMISEFRNALYNVLKELN